MGLLSPEFRPLWQAPLQSNLPPMKPDNTHRKEVRDLFAPRQRPKVYSAGGPAYRVAYACFACRKSFKLPTDPTTAPPADAELAVLRALQATKSQQ